MHQYHKINSLVVYYSFVPSRISQHDRNRLNRIPREPIDLYIDTNGLLVYSQPEFPLFHQYHEISLICYIPLIRRTTTPSHKPSGQSILSKTVKVQCLLSKKHSMMTYSYSNDL